MCQVRGMGLKRYTQKEGPDCQALFNSVKGHCKRTSQGNKFLCDCVMSRHAFFVTIGQTVQPKFHKPIIAGGEKQKRLFFFCFKTRFNLLKKTPKNELLMLLPTDKFAIIYNFCTYCVQ